MIWAIVTSQSCFCWLYRAFPSLAAKNIISLILKLTIWWCPWLESFLVLLEEGVCYDQRILLAKLLAFALLHFVLKGQICLLLQVSLDFLVLHSSPLWWKEYLFWMLVLEGLLVFIELFNFSFFSITGRGIDLNYCDVEWFTWKQTEIILSFLKLHPSTAFWALLLTMRATPFLLRNSCLQ